ncbi:MAG TPA: single-stranded DNA-binding protein [Bacteroidales bacterium]|nr:single-stranded DNA-binding protein [Bacteroidales bacterium]
MGNVNKVILIGRLGKDPEVIQFESGGKKVAFSLATTEVYYDKEQQKREITEWHNIVMWRGLAETAEKYLKKGDLLYVEGRIRTRSWDDKETQQKKYITEIQVDTMNMLGSPKAHQNGADTALLQVTEADQGGDLPF